jgi:hypothetical protein
VPQNLINMNDLFIPEFVETATIGGAAVACISTDLSTAYNVAQMGADGAVDLALIFKFSVAKPADGSSITFRGKEYRVQRVVEDSIQASFTVYLAEKYGGGA